MRGAWNGFAQDQNGNILPSATITVTNEKTGVMPVLYALDDTTTIGNPFDATLDGQIFFRVVGGFYRIDVESGGVTNSFRFVAIGSAQALDLPIGGFGWRTHTAAGDVTIAETDIAVAVEKTVGANTDVIMPEAASRSGSPVIIKKPLGNMNGYTVTPVFDGSETCEGLAGSAFQIVTDGGWVEFHPRPDGAGWYAKGFQL